MTIYERIKQLRLAKGMSQADLAFKVGYEGKSAISKVERGMRDISQSMIEKYAFALDVTPAFLLYGEKESTESKSTSNIFPLKTKRVPLIGEIACGKPIYAEEQFGDFVSVESDLNCDFCLKAQGDSMTGARIYDGDIVFIREQPTVENGEIAAVIIEDEATLKRVYFYPEKKKLVLNPENPSYEPLVYIGAELEQIRILGKAVAFQSVVR